MKKLSTVARRAGAAVSFVLGLVLVGASSTMLLAEPASAATPNGGCWVWYDGSAATPPAASSDISSSLAAWADPAAAPAGAADYTMTLAPASPHPNENVTISLTWNKGPKNGGPAAALNGTYRFKVNGTVVTGTKDFGTVAGGASVPGGSVTATFPAVAGANDVVFAGVTFLAPLFSIKIDCNGQSGGTAAGSNPRTAPVSTNLTASVTGAGDPVTPSPSASASTSPSPSASASPSASTSTSPSASATASTSPTASATASEGGKPASGSVDFACTLNPLGSDFDYKAKVSVSGYRAKAGDPVSLTATMSDLPGIAPVPIDGQMDVALEITAGGSKATLKGSDHATAAPKAVVPVPRLTGEVDADDDELDISVQSFTFAFPDLAVDADCTASKASLGTMRVGSEPDDSTTTGSDSSGGSTTGSGSGSLPHTGAGDLLPFLGLVAGALLLVGSGTLLTARRPYQRQH